MQCRSAILAAAIASLAFGSTTAFARGGMHGGMHGGHFGGFHHHHGAFIFGAGYAAYPYDNDYDEACPLVRRRVQTDHGLRWRLVRACPY